MNNSLLYYLAWVDFVKQLPSESGHDTRGPRRPPGDRRRWTRQDAIAAAKTAERSTAVPSWLTRLFRLEARPETTSPLALTTERTPTR